MNSVANKDEELKNRTSTLTFSAEKIYFEDHMKYFRISLFSTGEIQWHPGGIFRTTCALDVTYFPFDTQVSPGDLNVKPYPVADPEFP